MYGPTTTSTNPRATPLTRRANQGVRVLCTGPLLYRDLTVLQHSISSPLRKLARWAGHPAALPKRVAMPISSEQVRRKRVLLAEDNVVHQQKATSVLRLDECVLEAVDERLQTRLDDVIV